MTLTFFIDESGHSGDAVNSGVAYDFVDQPYFVLAAVGVEEEARLGESLEHLRSVHKIPAGELKSKLVQSRPAFVADVVSLVCEQELPFFIEVVDKKYFICSHLVLSQLLPAALGFPEGPALSFIRNHVVDFLYDEVSDEVLDTFVAACVTPSAQTLMRAFESQLRFARGKSATRNAQEVRAGMHQMVLGAMRAYRERQQEDPDAHLLFLPSPDLNKRSKHVWMLPNLSSFTNIYARINLFREGKLSDVRLVHDQQAQFDDILQQAKRAAESISEADVRPYTPHSDYLFKERASLEFASSHDSAGIQVADVIAGTVMRIYRDRLRGGSSPVGPVTSAFAQLLHRTDEATSVGVNQVVPQRHVMMPLRPEPRS